MAVGRSPDAIELPLVPLKNLVVFPHMIVPLYVGREKSVRALEDAMLNQRRVFLCAQRQVDCQDPGEADLFRVGVLGQVLQMARLPDQTVKVLVEGTGRAVIERLLQVEPHVRADIVLLDEPAEPAEPQAPVSALLRSVLDRFDRFAELSHKLPAEATLTLRGIEDPGRVADLVASQLPIAVRDKQELLETLPIDLRLEKLAALLERELEVLEVDRTIRQRVRQQVDSRQKEVYLKEQLRVIQEELGEDEGESEVDQLRDQLKALELAEAVQDRLLRDVDRLDRLPTGSPEVGVLRTYFDLVLALPWHTRTEDTTDIHWAERVLDEDHYGLEKVKDRIIEFLAVRQLTKSPKGPILCFVGPPGVGKTSLGKSIARALGRKFIRVSLGGVGDEAEIRGHRRTYVGSMPGRIIKCMREAGSRNPVFLLDEVDKLSSDFRGDPAAALLEVLDPEQNRHFSDHYLEIPFDLSEVLFLTTANVLYTVPRALQDRLEVISLPGYTTEEKLIIARDFLIPKQLQEHGLTVKHVEFTRSALTAVIGRYTSEAGLRNLERALAGVLRKVARDVVKGRSRRVLVTPSRLNELLGPPKFKPEEGHQEHLVGVAKGLAWTEVGGVLLTIEVITMPGKGNLNLTGQLGDVMQESARAALSFARSNAATLGIPADFREKYDLHIHIPKGAIPKDGPSAGISMAVAIVSALSQRPVRSDMALTGEITLRGRVLPIGGVKEKVLAAHRLGIKIVVLPEENEPDLVEIPANIRKRLAFRFVSTMDEVLAAALLPRIESPAEAETVEEPAEEPAAVARGDQPPLE